MENILNMLTIKEKRKKEDKKDELLLQGTQTFEITTLFFKAFSLIYLC